MFLKPNALSRSKRVSDRKVAQRKKTRRSVSMYEPLEPKQLLATLTVTTTSDVADGSLDGEVSLREAIIAANTNASFGDAASGEFGGDTILFDASLDGQTITLSGGELEITEQLAIRGNGLDITIDGNQQSRIFTVDLTTQAILRDFKITGGLDQVRGNAIAATNPLGTLRLLGMEFSNNGNDDSTALGGAVYVEEGTLVSISSTFRENSGGSGGAIYSSFANVRIFESTFWNNVALTGGAVSLSQGRSFVGGSTFIANNAQDADFDAVAVGGAISLDDRAVLNISSSSFTHNNAESGGAIAIADDSLLDVRGNSVFQNNRAFNDAENGARVDGKGGAIFNRGQLKLVDSELSDNNATFGGAFYTERSAYLNRVEFKSNSAFRDGGAIAVGGGFARIEASVIGGPDSGDGNHAGAFDGNRHWGQGGGIALYLSDDSSAEGTRATIIGGVIQNNSATISGGGIHADVQTKVFSFVPHTEGTIARGSGTQILDNHALGKGGFRALGGGIANFGEMVLISANVSGNLAGEFGRGGGIYQADGRLNIDLSIIAKNQAFVAGGGIEMAGGEARVYATTIGGDSGAMGNVAGVYGDDSLIDGVGGGVNMSGNDGTRFRMIRGELSNNTALNFGGALSNYDGNIVRLENGVKVSFNRAMRQDGGGAYNNGGHYEIRDAVFESNSARSGAGLFNHSGSANFINSSIRSNLARRIGGGIHNRAGFQLFSTQVSSNAANSFPDIFNLWA